jgi:hypothetical protein
VVFEAMRSKPVGLRAAVLNSPEFPDTDPFAEAFTSTRSSLELLENDCEADPVCAVRFPGLRADLRAAVERLESTPIRVRVEGGPVWMDGAALLRSLRARLSGMTVATGARLPATIATIGHRRDPARTLAALAALDASAQTYCGGYLSACSTAQTLSQGAYYSVLCRDEVPFTDVSALRRAAAGDAAWSADYVANPYLDACTAWDVPPASPSIAEPLVTDIPVYVDGGAFSPFVSPAVLREGTSGFSNLALGISPLGGDGGVTGVGGAECLDARLSFLNDPRAAVDFSCHSEHLRFTTDPI